MRDEDKREVKTHKLRERERMIEIITETVKYKDKREIKTHTENRHET